MGRGEKDEKDERGTRRAERRSRERRNGVFLIVLCANTFSKDPTLFTGTIRSNLDPFNQYDDRAVWHALGVKLRNKFVPRNANLVFFFFYRHAT